MTLAGRLFLVDSSVWISFLRRSDPLTGESQERIRTLLRADSVAVAGPIRMELLAGIRSDADEATIRTTLDGLHHIPIDNHDWSSAGSLLGRLRRSGVTVPSVDALLAVMAVRSGITLVHRDLHFEQIASHLPLLTESHLRID